MRAKPINGFTLTELMIALLIIGVIAAASIPNVLRARIRGNDNAAQTILGALAAAEESLRAEPGGNYWPLVHENPEAYDPSAGGAYELFTLADKKAPEDYRVYAVTWEDTLGRPHYCIGVMHHRGQSNAWVKTDRHLVDATKVDREEFLDYSFDEFLRLVGDACSEEITETG
jgi:prepilin-type N-terminal cleavage/methylation domain